MSKEPKQRRTWLAHWLDRWAAFLADLPSLDGHLVAAAHFKKQADLHEKLVTALEDIARGPLQGPGSFEQYAVRVAKEALAEVEGES